MSSVELLIVPSGDAHQVKNTYIVPSGDAHQVKNTYIVPSGDAHQVKNTYIVESFDNSCCVLDPHDCSVKTQ
jgi:mannose-6-phosphate isomerase-like protein (cupin superfamily)